MDRELLERQLAELPIVQYVFFATEELTFSDRVRTICEHECGQYGKSWACPPGVGTVEECRQRCLGYPHALLITSVAEVEDASDMGEALAARGSHEELTRCVDRLLRAQGAETYVLSAESCAVCERCTYPDEPCRFPDRMLPCVESHGILVTDIAGRFGIEFLAGNHIVTWFSLLLYREPEDGDR